MARQPKIPNRHAKPAAADPATTDTIISTTDLDGFLRALAGRLRVLAWALRGMAADEPVARERDEVEDPRLAMADDLDTAARAILAVAGGLCAECRVRDVAEGVRGDGAERPA